MPNHLINENSPYLLQHAHNPVDWFPWGDKALNKARAEDKPIFLSIGYAACHWCHVMAHESFEDSETAAFMNENYICIKVDREERPDIDSIYMQATIAMTGSGGWPMSVFLTPDLQPFYAGTYFPPVHRYNMPSFKEVLLSIVKVWQEERHEVDRVTSQVIQHIQAQGQNKEAKRVSTQETLEAVTKSLLDSYDWGYGGWGNVPKFPQPMTSEFLLRRALANSPQREQILKATQHVLNAMSRGGMYDVVGGGFARYSVDNFWRTPHFEKMLYDNALLARVYLHAWQVTQEANSKQVLEKTLEFVMREMTNPQGGFYSSLDADAEGVEGSFYVWTLDEIRACLKEDSEFFEMAYGLTAKGNWEGKTILQRVIDNASLAAHFKLDLETVTPKLAEAHAKLLAARDIRIRPRTDDKVLTAWNGLMLATFAEASRQKNLDHHSEYLAVATRNAEFLLSELRPNGQLCRAWRGGKTTKAVFLEDYAALILGLLELYQTDFNNKWFVSACELADEMLEQFSDPEGGFFDTPNKSESLIIRPKDLQDNATPCGNSLACEALLKLAAFTNEGRYRDLAEKSLSLITDFALKYPLGFAHWLSAAEHATGDSKQVAVLGKTGDETFERMLQVIQQEYRPNVVVAVSAYPPKDTAPTLLDQRIPLDNKATAYVCKGFVCEQPTNDLQILKEQLAA